MMRNEIAILYKYRKPPWGGGNQFLLALKGAFERKGIKVTSTVTSKTQGCLFNSHNVDFSYLKQVSRKDVKMVHRVDGPVTLYRKKGKEVDDKIFKHNNKFADVTVFQSHYSLSRTMKLGYSPKNPIIISNAVDYTIFNNINKCSFSRDRRVRLVTTSWSNNINKGYSVYKWLDRNLDWARFDYTYLGRVLGNFDNISLVSPKSSIGVANTLKSCDIYVTASRNESCSNAVVEALSCELPVLYVNSGSHSEFVKLGGLGFSSNQELVSGLDKLVVDYNKFVKGINVNSIDIVADKFLSLF